MQTSKAIIPILVMALMAAAVVPPAHAELATITAVLAVLFTSAVVTAEVIKASDDSEMAALPDGSETTGEASVEVATRQPTQR